MSHLRSRLLEAHVEFELARWRDPALPLRAFVDDLFQWLHQLRLEDASSVAQIMGVIERYVIELRVSGGIMELFGEMSQAVFDSPITATTRLDALLGDDAYEAFADKVARLESVRRQLIAMIARNQAVEVGQARLLSRALADVLFDRLATHGPLRTLLTGLERRIADALLRQLERRREAGSYQREHNLDVVLEPELVRSVADEIWSNLAAQPLSALFSVIDKNDLEDFVVLGHEFWLRYRKSEFFRRISEQLVGLFFTKYGHQSLHALIEDMGVTSEMVAHELQVFLLPLLREAARSGYLESLLRAQLEPFYSSPACAALLGD